MKQFDYLIIGGSAAGTTAAEVIRSQKSEAKIAIITDEPHTQYSRVLIPHYIRHKVSREQIFLKKEDWYSDRNVELFKGTKALSFYPERHLIACDNLGEFQYGKLLITTGGYVVRLDVPGADLKNVLYMRTVEDADRIIEVAGGSKKAVIIGGGFIGLEFASCLKVNGVEEITVLVREPYYWAGKLDEVSSSILVKTLEKNGIVVKVGEDIERLEGENKVGAVITKAGNHYDCDVVGVGIGIRSDLEWLKDSGLNINRAIVTNEYLETNLQDVYAAGDVAEFHDVVFDSQHIMGNWSNATSQGSVVGKTMAGQRTVFETASSYTINFFEPPAGGICSFIGVTDRDFAGEVIVRGSTESGKMTQIFTKVVEGKLRIVGATVINDASQVGPLSSAIKNRVDILAFRDKLADPAFDLRSILVD